MSSFTFQVRYALTRRAQKKMRNEKLGGDVPHGFRKVEIRRNLDGRIVWGLEEDPEGQRMIERILQLNRGGHTLRNIIAILEEEGFKPRKGSRISTETIRNILKRTGQPHDAKERMK